MGDGGLRDEIWIVKAGCIEMPKSDETKLYKDQKYDAVEFLKARGFEIKNESSNDVIVYFARPTGI